MRGVLSLALLLGAVFAQEGLRFRLPPEERRLLELEKEAKIRELELLIQQLEREARMREMDAKIQEEIKKGDLVKARTYRLQQKVESYFFAVPPSSAVVEGIVGRRAVIRNGLVHSEGSRVAGWRIEKVEPFRVVVELRGIRRQLTLVPAKDEVQYRTVERKELSSILPERKEERVQLPVSSEELARLLRGEGGAGKDQEAP